MTFHLPSLIEAFAILVIAFIGGFGWAAGGWLSMKIIAGLNRQRTP